MARENRSVDPGPADVEADPLLAQVQREDMKLKVGNRIKVEAESTERSPRTGVIEEVVGPGRLVPPIRPRRSLANSARGAPLGFRHLRADRSSPRVRSHCASGRRRRES
jgi:hypothetical protein